MAEFTFDGKAIPIQPGDTYASALHRAGVRVISRSLKYHRPRGLFCNAGSCASCYVGVDGVPNVPACMAAAKDGACLASQNRLGSARHDLLGVVDKVYWRGFDPHDAWTRSRLLNAVFLRGVRFMAGLGTPPPAEGLPASAPPASPPVRRTKRVDELIVGAGRSGLLRAKAAAGPNDAAAPRSRILLVDEASALGGSSRWDVLEAPTRQLAGEVPAMPGVECWTEALCFGLYPGESGPMAAIRRATPAGEELWEVTASRITLAVGAHDGVPTFTNNDLPGIMTYRGAMRLAREHRVAPGSRIVVHGAPIPPAAAAVLQELGAEVVATGVVSEARGASCVAEARIGAEWVTCDAIVCNLPGSPRIELYQQAGCELGWTGGVLAPRHRGGATSVPLVHAALPEAAA